MAFPRNYETFPENVLPPTKTEIDDYTYTIYGFRFKGLQDFYDFLKRNPRINLEVWSEHNISSEKNDFDFAGVPYDEAIEKLMKDMDPGYQEYLTIQKNLRASYAKTHKYEPIRTVAGGVINPVLYATGAPTVYDSSRLITRPKFITIDTQIAYYCGTTKSQVFNRAVIITNLIRALEKRGYNVNVNSFMMTENNSEIIKALFEIKQHGHRTNYQTLYKSLVDVEFFRRLCFRIMEVSDVQSYWPDGYGRPCEEDTVRKALHLKKDDIYFDQPKAMGIRGNEIGDDFESAVKRLHLEDKIDLEKEKQVIRESVKVLKK